MKEAASSVYPWLPNTWSQMSVEEQCSYLNDVLYSVANLVDEYDFAMGIGAGRSAFGNCRRFSYLTPKTR